MVAESLVLTVVREVRQEMAKQARRNARDEAAAKARAAAHAHAAAKLSAAESRAAHDQMLAAEAAQSEAAAAAAAASAAAAEAGRLAEAAKEAVAQKTAEARAAAEEAGVARGEVAAAKDAAAAVSALVRQLCDDVSDSGSDDMTLSDPLPLEVLWREEAVDLLCGEVLQQALNETELEHQVDRIYHQVLAEVICEMDEVEWEVRQVPADTPAPAAMMTHIPTASPAPEDVRANDDKMSVLLEEAGQLIAMLPEEYMEEVARSVLRPSSPVAKALNTHLSGNTSPANASYVAADDDEMAVLLQEAGQLIAMLPKVHRGQADV